MALILTTRINDRRSLLTYFMFLFVLENFTTSSKKVHLHKASMFSSALTVFSLFKLLFILKKLKNSQSIRTSSLDCDQTLTYGQIRVTENQFMKNTPIS